MSDRRHWLDRLTVAVMLRQIVALAGLAPTLTNAQLAHRLLALAGCGR